LYPAQPLLQMPWACPQCQQLSPVIQAIQAFKKLEQPYAPAAASEAESELLHLSTTAVEALEPCIIIDTTVADYPARALVDSGANACFVSLAFCKTHSVPVHTPKHRSATLANSSSATIHGQTTPQVVKIQEFSVPVVFQVLDTLDGIDVVLGMNFLSAHSMSILPKSRSVPIPMQHGSCLVVKSAPQAPAFTEFSTDILEVVSGARLARLVANEDCDVFLGYIKELTTIDHTSAAATAPSESQPPEFAQFEQDLLKEFADVLRDEYRQAYLPNESCRMAGRSNTLYRLNLTRNQLHSSLTSFRLLS
jgi:hypothetical protein